MVRDASPGDIEPVLAVYSACVAADPGYLPFLTPGDKRAILAWFRQKPLLACLIAELNGTVADVAGLRDAVPGPGAGQPGGRWLEACRLAVHPAHRGGAVTGDLARADTAATILVPLAAAVGCASGIYGIGGGSILAPVLTGSSREPAEVAPAARP